MRLSEAIRLGAMMKPQGFGHYFYNGKSCGIGAAVDAIGRNSICGQDYLNRNEIEKEFPIINMAASCHECGVLFNGSPFAYPATIGGTIAHLNDDHRWTRERIADWVELQEGLPELTEPVETAKIGAGR